MSKAIFIGRMRPFHLGHLHAITSAFKDLSLSSMVVLVGSSNRHRSVKNPFTFEEVKTMIYTSLPKEIKGKVAVRPLFDYTRDDQWQTAVRNHTNGVTHIVGYDKDESSYYLKMFPELKLFQPEPFTFANEVLSATSLRDLYFGERLMSARKIRQVLPQGSIDFLDKWVKSEYFALMKAEHDSAITETKKFENYPYQDHLNIACSDSVVTCNGMVLLVERKYSPGRGCLALPGGHKSENETFLDCALRELDEETKIKVPEKVLRGSLVSEKMFDDPKRSYPHTRITMAYHFNVAPNIDGSLPKVRAADDAESAKWYPLSYVQQNPERMYDDHRFIIQHFTGV